MKTIAWGVALLLIGSAAPAQPAVEPALPRADVQAAIGWQNLRGDGPLSNNNWIGSIALIDGTAGWYWTEHLRTQVDAGIGTRGRSTRFVDASSGGRASFQTIETEVQPATFAISQQYQFLHNAMFHPHVGVGALVRSEHLHEEFSPVRRFDPATGQSVIVEPSHAGDRSRTAVAALADVGFKAYVSQRGFFVTDARFTIRRRVEGVLFRFGFGLDF